MESAISLEDFSLKFGTSDKRKALIAELEVFLANLDQNFSNYRVIAYGSFISQKPEPGDIDVMVHVHSTSKDIGFNKFRKLQELATSGVDVFTLSLKASFGPPESVPDAKKMLEAFNALETHIAKGIHCNHVIELMQLPVGSCAKPCEL